MLTTPSAIVETTHKNVRYADLPVPAAPSTPLVDAIRAQRLEALTADDVRSLLTRSAFRAWLAEQRPTRIVGECQLPAACPVYQYLTYRGVPGVDVTSRNVEWNVEPMMFRRIISPGWLVAFVHALDATHGHGEMVTAADCLAVLDRLDEEWAFGSSGGSVGGMTRKTTFSGTSEECEDLVRAVARSCMCGFNIFGVRIHECAAHRAMLSDQKFVNGLVCYRRLRTRLLAEEGLTA